MKMKKCYTKSNFPERVINIHVKRLSSVNGALSLYRGRDLNRKIIETPNI